MRPLLPKLVRVSQHFQEAMCSDSGKSCHRSSELESQWKASIQSSFVALNATLCHSSQLSYSYSEQLITSGKRSSRPLRDRYCWARWTFPDISQLEHIWEHHRGFTCCCFRLFPGLFRQDRCITVTLRLRPIPRSILQLYSKQPLTASAQ